MTKSAITYIYIFYAEPISFRLGFQYRRTSTILDVSVSQGQLFPPSVQGSGGAAHGGSGAETSMLWYGSNSSYEDY
eukprot:608571-Pleurochrysis_carterae.AAC.2